MSREEESRKGDMKEGGEWYCECVRQREKKRVREWHNLGGGRERGREIVGSVVFGLVFEVCLLWLGVCSRCSDSVK